MIEPFALEVSGNGVISYGLSSAGYDIRLGCEFKVFKKTYCDPIDPKNMSTDVQDRVFDKVMCLAHDKMYIPPHGYVLGRSYEYFNIPEDVMVICLGKSTYARTAIIINVTPLEPGWSGHLTVEIANHNDNPAIVYPMEGIAQLLFFQLPKRPRKTYADKHGKYQNQTGVTPAIVK